MVSKKQIQLHFDLMDSGICFLQNEIQNKNYVMVAKPFFCAMSQFSVNNVCSGRNADIVNITLSTSNSVSRHLYRFSATSNINYGELGDFGQKNDFHIHNLK